MMRPKDFDSNLSNFFSDARYFSVIDAKLLFKDSLFNFKESFSALRLLKVDDRETKETCSFDASTFPTLLTDCNIGPILSFITFFFFDRASSNLLELSEHLENSKVSEIVDPVLLLESMLL